MDGLEAALERARSTYGWERGVMVARSVMSEERNRLRKVSPRRMVSGKATEMLEALDWWGIPCPCDIAQAERAKLYLLTEMEQRAGAPGDADLREAGFGLLDWWREQGNDVTATKVDRSQGSKGEEGAGDVDGRAYAPSPAVAWLAEQLPKIVPWLEHGDPGRPGWTPALDKAYTIAQAWRARWRNGEVPHWTALDPPNGPIAMDLQTMKPITRRD